MKKHETGTDGIPEVELVALLASLKVEPAPEADFEARFLYDLRERIARESVCCPARRLLWDHVLQFFANFGPRRLAYGASTLGLGVLAAGFFALPGGEEGAGAAVAAKASPLSRLEHSLSSLRPNRGVPECTTIKVGRQQKKPYTETCLAEDEGASPFSGNALENRSFPVNMGLEGYQGSFDSFSPSAASFEF